MAQTFGLLALFANAITSLTASVNHDSGMNDGVAEVNSTTNPLLDIVGRLGFGALALGVANLGLIVLYFVYDLSAYQLVFVFWCECLWVGLFSAVKLIAASAFGDPYENRWATVTPGAAIFTSILVIGFTSGTFFSLLGVLLIVILAAPEWFPHTSKADEPMALIGVGLGVSFLFLIGHGLSFIVNFLGRREFATARVMDLVTLPFKRCLALLAVTVISLAAVASIPNLASTGLFAALVLTLKLIWDVWLHLAERRSLAGTDGRDTR